MDLKFGSCLRLRRLWPPTGRKLGGGFRSVVLATPILFSDICQGLRGEGIAQKGGYSAKVEERFYGSPLEVLFNSVSSRRDIVLRN